jgi:hypothetical protein
MAAAGSTKPINRAAPDIHLLMVPITSIFRPDKNEGRGDRTEIPDRSCIDRRRL